MSDFFVKLDRFWTKFVHWRRDLIDWDRDSIGNKDKKICKLKFWCAQGRGRSVMFTFHAPYHKQGKWSQVDLCIANESALEKVKSFSIHQLPTNFSDHCQISTSIEINMNSSIPLSQVLPDILSHNLDQTNKKRPGRLPTNIN